MTPKKPAAARQKAADRPIAGGVGQAAPAAGGPHTSDSMADQRRCEVQAEAERRLPDKANLTLAEVAAFLGVHQATVRRLIEDGELNPARIRGCRRIPRAEALHYYRQSCFGKHKARSGGVHA